MEFEVESKESENKRINEDKDKWISGQVTCCKAGNSIMVHIPKHIKEELGLEPQDIVLVKVQKTGAKRKNKKEYLSKQMEKYRMEKKFTAAKTTLESADM